MQLNFTYFFCWWKINCQNLPNHHFSNKAIDMKWTEMMFRVHVLNYIYRRRRLCLSSSITFRDLNYSSSSPTRLRLQRQVIRDVTKSEGYTRIEPERSFYFGQKIFFWQKDGLIFRIISFSAYLLAVVPRDLDTLFPRDLSTLSARGLATLQKKKITKHTIKTKGLGVRSQENVALGCRKSQWNNQDSCQLLRTSAGGVVGQ